jgi:protein O-GlcNAc transferase
MSLSQQIAEQIITCFRSKRYDEALSLAQSFVNRFPKHSFGWKALGSVLKHKGRHQEALAAVTRATAINPRDFEALQNRAVILRELAMYDQAESQFRDALAIKRTPELLSSLGAVQMQLGRWIDSEATQRQALLLSPSNEEIWLNLAATILGQGRVDEAVEIHRALLKRRPDSWAVWSGLILSLHYSSRYSEAERREAIGAFSSNIIREHQGVKYLSWKCGKPSDRIKVGLVSADLRKHPVGYFMQAVVPSIDRTRVVLVVYANNPNRDQVTEDIARGVDAWHEVHESDDRTLATRIIDDEIHVAIDLSGHTVSNRLSMFSLKPAPVCVSWLGYFATTGLPQIDYVIADETGVPAGSDAQFVERVWRVPDTRLCFAPPNEALSVNELPALRSDYITLGCYQHQGKISDETLSLWLEALRRIDRARIRFQLPGFEDPGVAARFSDRLKSLGYSDAQYVLVAPTERREYLLSHHEVDFILDTFPYCGGTTTCEALWMGVPTLTLAGATMLSRQGASLLTSAGLPEWVAVSERDYVEKAVLYAQDLQRLALLRRTLRDRATQSPLFDAPLFAQRLADAIWGMWEETGAQRLGGALG